RSSDHDSCAKRTTPPAGRVAVATQTFLSFVAGTGTAGETRTLNLRFWRPLLCQLSYRRMRYLVSRCAVCLRHRGQNFDSSIRSGSLRRLLVVAYVRDRQVEQARVMIGRLSFGIAYSMTFVTAPAPTVWPPSRIANRRPSSRAIGV